jgi:hypothetical protein
MHFPAVTALGARYDLARSAAAKDRVLRGALRLTEQGAKQQLAEALQKSYQWLMKKLSAFRGSDGNVARSARSKKRHTATLRIRARLLRTTDGPQAASARRVARVMKATSHPLKVGSRTCQRYVRHELDEGTCAKKPAALRKDNCPHYHRPWQ